MEYQKIANLSSNESGQPSKFRTRNWVEINDKSRGNYANSDIRFKTTMLRSNLSDYADSYILVKGIITITGAGADAGARHGDERNKGVTIKNCAPFTKCINRINNADIDNAQHTDIVMPMYNLIEYSDNYSKTSGRLWQYYKDVPNNDLADSKSFKFKVRITGRTPVAGNTKDVEIIVPYLKYLSNFWRTLEMSLINCEINLILTWSRDCVITNSTGEGKYAITETKLYVPVVTLSTSDSAKLLQQLKSGFKKTISWNKYESAVKTFAQNRYLNYLINPSFQGVNRLFVFCFENENDRSSHSTCYLPKVELKDYNVMIDGRNFFDQPIDSMAKRYENIRKVAIGHRDDYTVGCLLDYAYFKENYKMIAIDLSRQQELDADSRSIQQINFTTNLDRPGNTTIFFIIEEAKENIFEFSQGTVKVL